MKIENIKNNNPETLSKKILLATIAFIPLIFISSCDKANEISDEAKICAFVNSGLDEIGNFQGKIEEGSAKKLNRLPDGLEEVSKNIECQSANPSIGRGGSYYNLYEDPDTEEKYLSAHR